jgi:hypothetical protein
MHFFCRNNLSYKGPCLALAAAATHAHTRARSRVSRLFAGGGVDRVPMHLVAGKGIALALFRSTHGVIFSRFTWTKAKCSFRKLCFAELIHFFTYPVHLITHFPYILALQFLCGNNGNISFPNAGISHRCLSEINVKMLR